jgi:hypothetical protein
MAMSLLKHPMMQAVRRMWILPTHAMQKISHSIMSATLMMIWAVGNAGLT